MLNSQLLKAGMGILLAGFFLVQGLSQAGQVDASHDQRAERFGRQVLSEVPKDALIFVRGDRAVFTLWYFHFALGERPDVAVVAEELLHYDWYVETLHSAYPALAIPSPLPWAQTLAAVNPARPLCYVQYVERPEIECAAP